MKKVGYFEGTDSTMLTALAAKGVDTLPLGNGEDGYGKYVGHITKADNVSLVIGYLHKIIPLSEQLEKPSDILYSCMVNKIPVIILVPEELQTESKKVLGDIAGKVKMVDPKNAMTEILKVLA